MCLAVPMKVVEIKGDVCVVESSGIKRDVGLQLLDGVEVNDWVIVHTGFAISKLDEEEAMESLKLLKEGGFIE